MDRKTYIYLMFDPATRCHKIGFSSNPSVRETTLQAEKPIIFMVAAFEGTRKDEQYLHAALEHRRVRGEWFRLYGTLESDDLEVWNELTMEREEHPEHHYAAAGLALDPDGVLIWRYGVESELNAYRMEQDFQEMGLLGDLLREGFKKIPTRMQKAKEAGLVQHI